MMKKFYWTAESWGSDFPPVNLSEVLNAANNLIDAFISAHPDYEDFEISEYSDGLWEDFCATGEIGGVIANYENE